ncbi:imidazole glycerol phosphate synthase subunit HisF [Enterobacteriaceae endosymbiont of Macroplea appendiculata]|uniref:imidazole glycerol phosphate synthase subunit HisF n=1 Tax=Enterobacteriaceae endosymbiont of Macroplea appendiculata TaxID=2675790 RepID=UPI0014492C4B|nr:imidazole glycerol phosphate synthase subunit HisF [Enterobacteriaceae endosymbiont of Macroplea appendiculata]QJC30746.1 imidazole glycerol phosphate synthase subunit HisF [Enterobacteriaceae endosymbiont of Macroplea appendiculata]
MLAKRIIPCLDVLDNKVVKGKQFKQHKYVGDIVNLAKKYYYDGADELVFYDITASIDNRTVDKKWITQIADVINIPFCVAGGIKSITDALRILQLGAEKISINTPALNDPILITQLSQYFGKQCVVVGIDSWYDIYTKEYYVYKYTGNIKFTQKTSWKTIDWVQKVQELGAGEIVLNMMNQDGIRRGYDILQLKKIRKICKIPLIASGGAGSISHFYDVFHKDINVDGALAASIFHGNIVNISILKKQLHNKHIEIRLC